MQSRRPATTEEVHTIAALVQKQESVGHILSKVALTEDQRELIQTAFARRYRKYQLTPRPVQGSTSMFRFCSGGAPGLVQQQR